MLHGVHRVWNEFLEEAAEDFGVKIGNCADDEKDLHEVDGDERAEWVLNEKGVEVANDEKDADIFLEILPAFVGAARQLVQKSNARREAVENNGNNACEGDHGEVVAESPAGDRDGDGEHMDKDQEERSGGGAAMGYIHLVQTAKLPFSSFGPRGQEQ